MNIFRQLEKEHSKENSLSIVSYIGNDSERFAELMDCFFAETKDYRVPQRAAHTLSLTFDKQPDLILPYREKLIQNLENPKLKSSLKRNILRILQFTEVEEHWMGNLYENCFELVANPKEEIAIRAFAMVILYNISNTFPELKPELKLLIESVLEEPEISPGVRSKSNHILKKLYKELD